MIIRRLRTTVLLAVSLTLFSQPVSGTGGSATSAGAFTLGAADGTGAREWVELVGTGGLLSGRPNHKSIKLITVYAPGCDESHLILRELEFLDGRRSLLFSAPVSLLRKTLRATIYVKHHSMNLVLLEYAGGSWKLRKPQPIRVAAEDDHEAPEDNLLAFSVSGLGFYWLMEGNAPGLSVSSITSQDPSAIQLPGGSISRGVLPWAWSVLLLAVGWTVSRWLHRIERHAGN
jgi:hypothetical protein